LAAPITGIEINHRLQIDGRAVPVDAVTVSLMLNEVGFALFTIPAPAAVKKGGFAEFFISVAGGAHYLVFTGAVTEVQLGENRQQLKVRELSAVLEFPCFFFLRQTTLREVIARIEQESKLHFILPSGADYLNDRKPAFESKGSCKNALAQLPKAFDVPDAVWYQMPDGTIYWGAWQTGPFTKAAVPIEGKLILENDTKQNLLRLPCIPALRPGMWVQSDFRFRIDAVTFQGDTVLVEYTRL
jgi:hypothetical protein